MCCRRPQQSRVLGSKHRPIFLQELALYLDYRLDESYTPKIISIRAGNSFTDMVEVHTQELEEPHGWTRIPLETQNSLQGVQSDLVYQPWCVPAVPMAAAVDAACNSVQPRLFVA